MDLIRLKVVTDALLVSGKGILAIDESTPTMARRLRTVGIENTLSNRNAYRTLLLRTPGLGKFISGAILFDETLRQSTGDRVPLVTILQEQQILVGIKVDTGARDLAGHPGEKITEGLDGLRERLAEYAALGAQFCKWRAVIRIGDRVPSRACIEANAHTLARYAMLCQDADLVPIVEPEILMDGDHDIERCYEITLETQRQVFDQLYRQGVAFSGMILKASMVLPGSQSPTPAAASDVATLTLRNLMNAVPAAVPGIAFLSGGQSEREATVHLNTIARLGRRMSLPWQLTFSYGRALQQSALTAWKGDAANSQAAQHLFLNRARLNALAAAGEYEAEMEQEAA